PGQSSNTSGQVLYYGPMLAERILLSAVFTHSPPCPCPRGLYRDCFEHRCQIVVAGVAGNRGMELEILFDQGLDRCRVRIGDRGPQLIETGVVDERGRTVGGFRFENAPYLENLPQRARSMNVDEK